MMLRGRDAAALDGLTSHAHLEALLEATILTLVPMMLVNRAAPRASTRIREVAANGSLEEALASFAGKLSVMFP